MKFSEFRKGGKKLVLTAAVLIAVVAGALVVTAATTEPGSSSDPVVTKSYVDSAIADALADAGTGSGSSSSYEVVHVEAGKDVIATGADGDDPPLGFGEGDFQRFGRHLGYDQRHRSSDELYDSRQSSSAGSER